MNTEAKNSFECPESLERYRVTLCGEIGDKQNGFLLVKDKGLGIQFSNGDGWEHVSVSRRGRMPDYNDMTWVKQLFWPDACVMELHVPQSDHINVHPYCLHLWKPINQEIPRPPSWMVA